MGSFMKMSEANGRTIEGRVGTFMTWWLVKVDSVWYAQTTRLLRVDGVPRHLLDDEFWGSEVIQIGTWVFLTKPLLRSRLSARGPGLAPLGLIVVGPADGLAAQVCGPGWPVR